MEGKKRIPYEVISVKIINIDTDEEEELSERLGSRCHFNEVFTLEKYFIQLRLDWGDIKNGEPVLDADIWTETEGRKEFLRKEPSHHTLKEFDDTTGQYLYKFRFKNLELRLITQKTIAKAVSFDAILEKNI